MNAQHDECGGGAAQLHSGGQAALAPGGVDDNVVLAFGVRGAELLTGGDLLWMAGDEPDVASERFCGRNGAEADGAAANHRNPHARLEPSDSETVDGDGQRFDERRVRRVEPGGQRDEAVRRHADPLRHAAIPPEADGRGHSSAAQMPPSRDALIAGMARHVGLYGDGPSVGENACDLVADRRGERSLFHHMEIGAADARGSHLNDDVVAIGVGFVGVNDLDAGVGPPYRAHATTI